MTDAPNASTRSASITENTPITDASLPRHRSYNTTLKRTSFSNSASASSSSSFSASSLTSSASGRCEGTDESHCIPSRQQPPESPNAPTLSRRMTATQHQIQQQNASPIPAKLPQGKSRFHHFIARYGSLELENHGSVARDHLALERTFLAWLRTSLAFASIGIAITQLFRLNRSLNCPKDVAGHAAPCVVDGTTTRLYKIGKPLGATFVAIAIVVLLIGSHRYFEAQYWIINGRFPASRGSVIMITFIAATLIVASLVVVLSVDNGSVA